MKKLIMLLLLCVPFMALAGNGVWSKVSTNGYTQYRINTPKFGFRIDCESGMNRFILNDTEPGMGGAGSQRIDVIVDGKTRFNDGTFYNQRVFFQTLRNAKEKVTIVVDRKQVYDLPVKNIAIFPANSGVCFK